LIHNLTTLEQEQRRNSTNVELDGRILVVVDVQLADRDPAAVIERHRVHRGRKPFARATPFGPKIDQDRLGGFEHGRLEIAVGEGLNQWYPVRIRPHGVFSRHVSPTAPPETGDSFLDALSSRPGRSPLARSTSVLSRPGGANGPLVYFDVLQS